MTKNMYLHCDNIKMLNRVWNMNLLTEQAEFRTWLGTVINRFYKG